MKSRRLFVRVGYAVAVLCLVMSSAGSARGQQPERASSSGPTSNVDPMKTFYLKNAAGGDDSNDLLAGLRLMLDPHTKLYLVPSQNAIAIRATPDQLVLAQQFLDEMDRPKKTYRLVFTVNEFDGAKRVGSQHFTLAAVTRQRTTLKQGSKVPIVTGAYDPGKPSQNQQVTYLDVGMSFDVTLDEAANGVRLRSKVEQSSIAEEKSGIGVQDPVVRQSVLEGTSVLTPGKAMVLGSLDTPGSTRHLDVEVVLEVVK